MGAISLTHWLIFGLIASLLFGTSKLKDLGRDLASGIRAFKEGLKDDDPRGS